MVGSSSEIILSVKVYDDSAKFLPSCSSVSEKLNDIVGRANLGIGTSKRFFFTSLAKPKLFIPRHFYSTILSYTDLKSIVGRKQMTVRWRRSYAYVFTYSVRLNFPNQFNGRLAMGGH